MTDFLMGLASFALVLIPLVVIHEFGHFLAAKLVGITVLEFGIGFPPRAAVLFEKGGTLYTLNWLPIGFVRPYGEDMVLRRPRRNVHRPARLPNATSRTRKASSGDTVERIFMAAGPGINLLTALVIHHHRPGGDAVRPRRRDDLRHHAGVASGAPSSRATCWSS